MPDLLPCVETKPAGPVRSSVVWLHGLGANGHDFEPIVPMLRLPSTRFVFPHAPNRPVTINGGMVMPAWYDIRSLAFGPGREDDTGIRASAAQVEALIAREVERGVPAEKIVLGGFSQGAAMALHVGHRHREKLAGLVILSGYLLLPHLLSEGAPANAATPIFFGHGRHDDVVPILGGRAAYGAFDRPGREVTWKEYPIAHQVNPEEIADIGTWIKATLEG